MKTHGKLFPNLIAAGFLLTAVFFLLRCFDIIHGMLLGWVIAPIWVAMLVLAVILLIGRAAKLGASTAAVRGGSHPGSRVHPQQCP